jgi:hypothetical protein
LRSAKISYLLVTDDFLVEAAGGKVENIFNHGNGSYIIKIMPEKDVREVGLNIKIQNQAIKVNAKVSYRTRK